MVAREAVLFIHSTGTGPLLWSTVQPETVGSRRMLFPSNLGYPPNAAIERGEAISALDDAKEVTRAVPDDIERLHIVAHSYGALVALKALPLIGEARVASLFLVEPVVFGSLAATTPASHRGEVGSGSHPEVGSGSHPEVGSGSHPEEDAIAQAKEFLAHPWFLTDDDKGGREEWLEMFIDYWNRPGSWKKMAGPVRDFTLSMGWKMFQEVRACFHDDTPFEAWNIPAPTTIMRGDRSPIGSRTMAKLLARDRSNVILVDAVGTGHMAPLTHPGIVHAELARHFARSLQ